MVRPACSLVGPLLAACRSVPVELRAAPFIDQLVLRLSPRNMSAGPRYIGVTVLCDYVLSEGVDAVLENLRRVGASAVAVNPTVTTEASEGQEGASWQPPSDGGTSPVRALYRHSLVEPHAIAVIVTVIINRCCSRSHKNVV